MKGLKILIGFMLLCTAAFGQRAQKVTTWYDWEYGLFPRGLSIPSGGFVIPEAYRDRVHIRGSLTDSTLEVWVPSLLKWSKLGGLGNGVATSLDSAFRRNDTLYFSKNEALYPPW